MELFVEILQPLDHRPWKCETQTDSPNTDFAVKWGTFVVWPEDCKLRMLCLKQVNS